MTSVRCAIYRGGTSRAVFFRVDDVPPRGRERDEFLLAVMGSPHIRQVDGLGGAHPATSKVALVGTSTREDSDVEYTFAQVDVGHPRIDYTGICGNISAAVGPFAIDSGLVAAGRDSTTVRIFNTNIGRVIRAAVPTADGATVVDGDFAIDGVAGTGAPIVLDYSATAGTLNGRILPTGKATDRLFLADGRPVDATICDLAYPAVFVASSSAGLDGTESPAEIEANPTALSILGEIRALAAVRLGLAQDVMLAGEASPLKPIVMLVSRPATKPLQPDQSLHISSRAFVMGRIPDALPGSGALCLATAARVPGSVVRSATVTSDGGRLRIGHPSGHIDIQIEVEATSSGPDPILVRSVTMARTARPIMDGRVFIQARNGVGAR